MRSADLFKKQAALRESSSIISVKRAPISSQILIAPSLLQEIDVIRNILFLLLWSLTPPCLKWYFYFLYQNYHDIWHHHYHFIRVKCRFLTHYHPHGGNIFTSKNLCHCFRLKACCPALERHTDLQHWTDLQEQKTFIEMQASTVITDARCSGRWLISIMSSTSGTTRTDQIVQEPASSCKSVTKGLKSRSK